MIDKLSNWVGRSTAPGSDFISRHSRLIVAILIGAVSAAVVGIFQSLKPVGHHTDFGPVWFGARALLAGKDAYAMIGPGQVFDWSFGLSYPATALVIAAPLSGLSEAAASTIFVGLSTALLAFAITDRGFDRLPLFLSAAFVNALTAAQWSPMMTAAISLPWLGWMVVAKPSYGLALLAFTRGWSHVAIAACGGALILVVSLLLRSTWPFEWMASVGRASFTAPIHHFGGFLMLLALLKWRRPEARLLVAMTIMPQTFYWYETLPLMLIPATYRQSLVLSLGSSTGYAIMLAMLYGGYTVTGRMLGALMITSTYLPCLWLVLLRPNEAKSALSKVI